MEFPQTLTLDGRQWTAGVDGCTFWTRWGKEGGKQQSSRRVYECGKQGRTASEQALFEAAAAVRRKLHAGYAVQGGGAPAVADAPERPPLPMLATDWQKLKKPERLLAGAMLQPKLDGVRCIADTTTGDLFSRTGKPFEGLENIRDALRAASEVAHPPCRWLDGEVYAHGMGFQAIVGAVRKTAAAATGAGGSEPELEFHVFDAIKSGPFVARSQQVYEWLHACRALLPPHTLASIQSVDTELMAHCPNVDALRGEVEAAMDRYTEEGYEGAIVRAADASYARNKRSLDLVKAKRFQQEEFEIVGMDERPQQRGIVAAVSCRTHDGKVFGATPESTLDEKRAMWNHRALYTDGSWVATVRFQENTDGGVPRFPVCAGVRHKDDCGTAPEAKRPRAS